jgi:patatin-like phospholipase/acyl hydrolase
VDLQPGHREPAPETAAPDFRVLAIDGGGIRGIFTAALLAGLEEDLGLRVVHTFDLIVGTSTGGIIALALGAGMAPREIVNRYVELKDRVFPRGRLRAVRHLARSKYEQRPLQEALQEMFGESLLGDSSVPLVIPTFNITTNDIHLLKTPHHPTLRRDHRLTMWQVALATSAAPTFFPAYRLPVDEIRLVDGGVWANNPSLVGVTEAICKFDQPLANISLFNVGTTMALRRRDPRLDRGGILQWLRTPKITDVMLEAQTLASFKPAELLLGSDRAYRLSPPVPEGLATLDDCDAAHLIGLASGHSRQFSPTFQAVFVRPDQRSLTGLRQNNGAHRAHT